MTTHAGRCQCGAVRYEADGEPAHVALCHCDDCRRSAGAPMVAWAAFPEVALRVVAGEPRTYSASGVALRSFCGTCGSGLFYRNETLLPGLVDIQTATFDDPEAMPPGAHIQGHEMLGWMKSAHELMVFERYPPQ